MPWENPSKKFCSDGVNVSEWIQEQNEPSSSSHVAEMSEVYKQHVELLAGMGFPAEEIDSALRLANNDIERAVMFLTRDVPGLDQVLRPTSSQNTSIFQGMMMAQYVESDEEELEEEELIMWRQADEMRVRSLIETYDRYIFYRKNGSLARCLEVAYNMLRERTFDWVEVIPFVDEVLLFVITRHVNPSDNVYLGEQEVALVQELYRAVIPVVTLRLTYAPINIKSILYIEEMFNTRNKFISVASGLIKQDELTPITSQWCDISLVDSRFENKAVYVELVDAFVQNMIPCLDRKLDSDEDEPTVPDAFWMLRALNCVTNVLEKSNTTFCERIEAWVAHALGRVAKMSDKEIRDSAIRRNAIELIGEVVQLCEKFNFDVFTHTQEARMEFLKKCIKCPQMECMLFAMEELGQLADKAARVSTSLTGNQKVNVSEVYLKKWLTDNKVLQIVLTGNMDSAIYVEKIQPILHYMTPELTYDDLKFVWSLRKGRLGVSGDNFNRTMELIVRALTNDQIEWVVELFRKSFRNRETRLFESIFNYCYLMAVLRDRDHACKLHLTSVIWDLIWIGRGPPLMLPFKSLELGIKKHCDLLNSMNDKTWRDDFLMRIIKEMDSDETFSEVNVVYLYVMLDKLKRIMFPRKHMERTDEFGSMMADKLRCRLREMRLFENLLDRLLHLRKLAHDTFEQNSLNSIIGQESASSSFIFFEPGGSNESENVLTVPVCGSSDYGFVMDCTLRLIKWLIDNDAGTFTVEFVDRLFDIFVFSDDSTPQEKARIFSWLSEFKVRTVPLSTLHEIPRLFCKLDPFTLQVDGLRCFSTYLEDLPFIATENDPPLDEHVSKLLTDCKLFLWKLILFNNSDVVFGKCIDTFCERELTNVESARFLRSNTKHFLTVFVYYVQQLKAELCKRAGIENKPATFSIGEETLSDDEIKQHEMPPHELLTDVIIRAIDRLIRFLTRFVQLGNDKNIMIRQFPSHGSSISGHNVALMLEMKNDDDDDCEQEYQWKSLVCDSNTTVGELKVRLAKRLLFHEDVIDFGIYKRDDDILHSETSLRCDYMTLQEVKLASESDSIFLPEKIRVLVKPKKASMARSRTGDCKKGIHELFLPAHLVMQCNFYDLLLEFCSLSDERVRNSCRQLLATLPTQPDLLASLQFDPEKDEISLAGKVLVLTEHSLNPTEPYRMLYVLEAISSVVCPTRLTPSSARHAMQLSRALIESQVCRRLVDDVLRQPHVVPHAHIVSSNERHAIFERIVQICRAVYVGKSTLIKSISNEYEVRVEMKRTSEQLRASRQAARDVNPRVEFVVTRQKVGPEGVSYEKVENEPLKACDDEVIFCKVDCMKTVIDWSLDEITNFLITMRDFAWVHVATECASTKPIRAYPEPESKESKENDDAMEIDSPNWKEHGEMSASEIIRSTKLKGERWGDECRLVIVRKVLSTVIHVTRRWVRKEGRERNSTVRLLANMFMHPTWARFYEDVLVNSYQEAYRKYMQEGLVKMSRENHEILCMILKMLLDLFCRLPFVKLHTSELDALEKRQRFHCDGVVQTICECILVDRHRQLQRGTKCEIDWAQVGHVPFAVVQQQMKSLVAYKPKFSQTDCEESATEETYCGSKLRLVTCLLTFCSQEQIESCSTDFLKNVVSDFLFPEQQNIEEYMFEEDGLRWEGMCRDTAITAVNTLCSRSFINMFLVMKTMERMPFFRRPFDPNYKPIIRGRVYDQVGLKNDGGTCYMNATIQQLAHVPGLIQQVIAIRDLDPSLRWGEDTAALVVELQKVLSQLAFSRAQACVPSGMWREFRFEPDVPLNTKQHHDAIDFYSVLLDRCDNVMKKLDLPPIFHSRFFGKYSYEKICYGCWHRYQSPDEEFNCISLALHGDNLEEGLDNFLDAHVMEGENAYHCEKCDEKKTTLNRTSFRELPSTMTIQLKRFTYDVVHNMIKKDNQFFKFPFEIDMQPYMTSSRHVADEDVQGLFDDVLYVSNEQPPTPPHKSSNGNDPPTKPVASSSSSNLESPQKKLFRRHRSSTMRLSQCMANTSAVGDLSMQAPPKPMMYELVGVLAHSGIATAGHYYSFVKERREEMRDSPSFGKWYHLNDMVSTPMNMNNIDDIWYGGSFIQDSHFNDLPEERIRHWNAYVLVYEKKLDPDEVVDTSKKGCGVGTDPTEAAPKVTFDCTDEISCEADRKVSKQPSARELRHAMFNSMDDKQKTFLSNENSRFLKDRDYFSFDLYNIIVQSFLQLLRSEGIVMYDLGDVMSKDDFYRAAFKTIWYYISHIAWQMFDDARPKQFPRSATDVIKHLLNAHKDNKMEMMTMLEANKQELLLRLIELPEPDIKHSVWTCIRHAMRKWCVEVGSYSGGHSSDSTTRLEMASPDSSDVDEELEDEDDEVLDDEDTESEGELTATAADVSLASRIGIARPERVRAPPPPNTPQRIVNDITLASVMDLSHARVPRTSTSSSGDRPVAVVGPTMMTSPHQMQRNIVIKMCQFIALSRLEFNGRHTARYAVDTLLSMARTNSFACSLLNSCNVLSCVTEFLFEGHKTVLARLHYPEQRLKSQGLWPNLPCLYFELLHRRLETHSLNQLDSHLTHRHAIPILTLYCIARSESEDGDHKGADESRLICRRIIDCFARQILMLTVEDEQEALNYITRVVQTIVKDMVTGCQFPEEWWAYCIAFLTELALCVHNIPCHEASMRIVEELLDGQPLPNGGAYEGLLPMIQKWLDHDFIDRAQKMFDALYLLRRVINPDIASIVAQFRRQFSNVFAICGRHEEEDDEMLAFETIRFENADSGNEDARGDEIKLDESTEKRIIGPMPDTTDDENSAPQATATARVTHEISLAELANDEPTH